MTNHVSVLKKEAIDLLQVKSDGVYVDLTLGGGGHSGEILELLDSGKLYTFDVDKKAITEFQKLVDAKYQNKNIDIINDNFVNFDIYITQEVDGILADLGWSTDQLGHIEGLSYINESELLDMRLNSELGVTAADLLNVLTKKQLVKVFEEYGDMYGNDNRHLVEKVIDNRKQKLFKTVGDVTEMIRLQFPALQYDSILKKVFQSLRIAVNQELSILTNTLPKLYKILGSGGILAVITFHSGEEKIVTDFFKDICKAGNCELITKSTEGLYIRPTVDELKTNLRARSAKLFCIKKL